MHLTIKRFQSSADIVMIKMADNMRGKFEKYWVHSSLKNNLLLLGVVFDPRYKFKHVEFCFEQIYGDAAIGKDLSKGVKLELEELFKCYLTMYASKQRVDTTNVSNEMEFCDEFCVKFEFGV